VAPPTSTDRSRLGSREGALAPYLRAIQAHRLIFGLVVIATVAAAAIWTSTTSNEYSATAQILVTPLPQDNQTFFGFDLLRDSGDPTRTVQTAAALIETREAADRAAKVLGDGRTGQQVLNSITVQPAGESNVLDVTATASNPSTASLTANAFTTAALTLRRETLHDQLKKAIERLEATRAKTPERERRINTLSTLEEHGDPTLSVAQLATPSDSPVGPSAVIVIGLALLAGLTLGTAAVVVLEMTARKIRDEDEAMRLYPLPVLARVPIIGQTEQRRQKMGFWSMQPSIREPFRTVMAQLQRESQRHVVMLTSGSTSDGKTTSSINLAMTVALGGHSTILVDADFRKPGIAEALRIDTVQLGPNAFDDPDAIERSLVQVPNIENLRLLTPSTPDPQGEALIEAFSERLPVLLKRASKLAQYVVVDTAPLGEVGDALRIMPHVNDIILVVYPGNTNRANYEIMRELLERAGDRPTGLLIIGDQTGASFTYYGYGTERQRKGLSALPDRHEG
jgi:capsular exopolysaccharide synthesis family protein